MVIPVTDASAEAVLGNREWLPPGLALPFASHAIYREASDKVRVHEIALECGIGIEESAIVRRQGDAAPDDAALYPGYVKPHRSVVGGARRVKTGVRFVATREECERVLRDLDPAAFPVLVQRRIVGPGEGVFLARWGRRTIARFAHRRLREKPPSGGVSVYRESILPDPAVMAACERLLDALNWEGVAMIEGKRDLASGAWRVMEINGRFWGSLQLAIDAGVDFPSRLVRAVLGENVGDPPAWTPGVRLRWEWGEVDHLLIRLRRSREALNLPAEAPGKLGAVAAFLAHRPGRDRCEVLRLGDPLPFVVESLARLGVAR
jgi:predicted ATP-grasp superfamily ATP-dependent carboligase